MWYVIQTVTGQEELVRSLIEKTVPHDLYSECRVLYYETRRRYQGSWRMEKRRLFPGYLFIVTGMPLELRMQLRNFPEKSRMLGADGVPLSLAPEEEAFLKRLAGEEDLIPLSVGIQEGDRIIVAEGCLKGIESRIRRVDRHKRKAYIEIEILGQTRLAEVGLEIVRKV